MIKYKGKNYSIDFKRIFALLGIIFGIGLIYCFIETPNDLSFYRYFKLVISNSNFIDLALILFALYFIIKSSIYEVNR